MSDGPIHRYLHELRGRVPGGPLRRRRVLGEVRAHLEDAAHKEQQAGHTPEEAERLAVERFGVPFPDRQPRWATRIAALAVVGVIVVAAVAAALASRGGTGAPRAQSAAVPWASVPICASADAGPSPASEAVATGPVHIRFLACRPQPAVGTPRTALSPIGRVSGGATSLAPSPGASPSPP